MNPAAMRIGIDAREGFRPHPRGIGLYVRHLAREFAALAPAPEHELLLYHQLLLPPDCDNPFVLANNQRAVHTDIPGGRFHSWERLQMPWRLRRDRLDVYHGTYNTLPPRWPLWKGPPMVVTLHDLIVTWYDDDLHDPFTRYARQVTPRVVRDATLILTVSEWSKRDICERHGCDPGKVRITRNGLHPEVLKGAPTGAGDDARRRFAEGRPYLFAVGASLERKNTGRLIEAFGLARQRRPDLPHLLLVSGLGKAVDRFRERATAAGVLEHVRFLPYLSQQDLIATYAGAALCVYPSLVEGWGIPVTEALALGTPVLTSNTSAMPEAGGDDARYFDPNDVDSMAVALIDAIERYVPTWPQRRDQAMARVRQLTWTRTAEQTLQAYRDAAARR
ncbi:MAG: glycosyltransferase family 4 protein [Planctomycetes bacterium]|nr:glycosyltransferase family 4 protein [Planctomycetota bacterium]